MPVLVVFVVTAIDPLSALVLIVTGPVLVILLAVIGGRARKLADARFDAMSRLASTFVDMLEGLVTLKLFGGSKEQLAVIREATSESGRATMVVLRTAFETALVLELCATVAVALVAVEMSLRLMAGGVPFGTAFAVLVVTPEFFAPIRQLALSYHARASGVAAAARIFAVLDDPVAAETASVAVFGEGPLSGVSFETSPLSTAVANHRPSQACLSPSHRATGWRSPAPPERARARSRVCCWGSSNQRAERSPQTATGYTRSTRENGGAEIGWVPQHPRLFHGTISDNLRLGRAVSEEAMVAAARAAHADGFIRTLPDGYETILGERGARAQWG